MTFSRAASRIAQRSRSSRVPALRRNASGAPQYNEPTGHIFGEKPLLPEQKRQKESWERPWFYGMFGGMAFGAVILAYRPDTTVQTWALAKAEESLNASGKQWRYVPSVNSGHPEIGKEANV